MKLKLVHHIQILNLPSLVYLFVAHIDPRNLMGSAWFDSLISVLHQHFSIATSHTIGFSHSNKWRQRFRARSIEAFSCSSDVLMMAAPRNLMGDPGRLLRDEENAEEDDSPSGKKPKFERFPLNRWEFAAAIGVFFVFSTGLFCIYLTMPAAEYGKIKLPRTVSDLRMLK